MNPIFRFLTVFSIAFFAIIYSVYHTFPEETPGISVEPFPETEETAEIEPIQEEITNEQESLRQNAPKVYLDPHTFIDIEYIKTRITFVNYVIDKEEADIHLLITSLGTAGGGDEFTIQFLGKGKFDGEDYTLKHFSKSDDTLKAVLCILGKPNLSINQSYQNKTGM